MIRTAYPVPPIKQFRLRLELATRRTRRALEDRCRSLRSGNPFPDDDTLDSRFYKLKAQYAAYREFEERFDNLVGLICLSAQEGVNAEREAEYRQRRGWFVANYASIQPLVADFLTPDASDHAPGWWRQRSCDAFEALFLPVRLSAMLADDNGHVIARLTRTQNCLADWYDSLRLQESALACCR